MIQSETRYEIMEGEDEWGFIPACFSEPTLEEAEAQLQKLHEEQPDIYRNCFICKVVSTRVTARTTEVNHELQTIPTAG